MPEKFIDAQTEIIHKNCGGNFKFQSGRGYPEEADTLTCRNCNKMAFLS